MTSVVTALAFLFFALPAGPFASPRLWRTAPDPSGPGDSTHTIVVDGRPRTYLAHVPLGYDGHTPLPVVLVFHGGASNAAVTARFTGLSDKADQAHFLAVYPSGSGRLSRALTWNAGSCCGYAEHEHVDDVAFVRALLDDLPAHFAVDARRIYATGISNGGMMAHRVAAELADRIAAIASVSGPLALETIHPSRPVSVMHFHGTADEFAPFAGGTGEKSLSRIHFPSVAESVGAWLQADGCPEKPEVTALRATAGDATRVRRAAYGPCKQGAEVVLYVIEGGGHRGRKPRVRFLGTSTTSVSANDRMWEFFERRQLDFAPARSARDGRRP